MKKTGVVLVVAAVLVPAVARAGVPTGFVARPMLSVRASQIAGKQVTVYCAKTTDTWAAFLTNVGDAAVDVNGVTLDVGGTETYLEPTLCATLVGRLAGKPVVLDALGASVDVLAHESIHLRGESDEGKTECAAIRAVPGLLVTQWGFRRGSKAYAQTLYGARRFHSLLDAQYRAVC